jgi:hypothetical protein
MVAANVSGLNRNFAYGEITYFNGTTNTTKYGWFNDYTSSYHYYSGEYHEDCRRDVKYSIAPCCTITVTK